MNSHSQLRQQTAAELTHGQEAATQAGTVREFATPEELLRHDRAQTPVPDAVATRLEQSLAVEPVPAKPAWWRRWLSR